MDKRHVQTVVLLILVIVDIFLASIFFTGERDRRREETSERQALTAILQDAGISMNLPIPKQMARARVFVRDIKAESEWMLVLLGDCDYTDLGGGIVQYKGQLGDGRFRTRGEFLVSFTQEIPGDKESIQELIGRLGLADRELTANEDGFELKLQTIDYPIWDTEIQFTVSAGQLQQVSGTWLLGESLPIESVSRSAMWSLVALARLSQSAQSQRTLHSMDLGYQILSINSDVVQISPVWNIEMSDRLYRVNAITGEELDS